MATSIKLGILASDSYKGYVAHCAQEMWVLSRHGSAVFVPIHAGIFHAGFKVFYYDLGDKIWGEYGFADGFNEEHNWYAKTHLAIDQRPIVVMTENYRRGLIWKLFMQISDIQNGLKNLGLKVHG